MTQIEAMVMIVRSESEECKRYILRAMENLQRRTGEMADAISQDGTPKFDLHCHAGNISVAAAELAKLGERLAGLQRLLKLADSKMG